MNDEPPTETPPSDTTDEASRAARLEAALKESDAKVADLTDRLKRLAADFDNFRKRARREADEAGQLARERVLRDLLAVSDNFDRAFLGAGSEEALYDGVRLIYKQFQDLLVKEGLERIDATGHPFDPLVHESVMREVTTAYAEGAVIQEFERGYRYKGKVLRPAKVKVAAAPPATSPPDEAGSNPP